MPFSTCLTSPCYDPVRSSGQLFWHFWWLWANFGILVSLRFFVSLVLDLFVFSMALVDSSSYTHHRAFLSSPQSSFLGPSIPESVKASDPKPSHLISCSDSDIIASSFSLANFDPLFVAVGDNPSREASCPQPQAASSDPAGLEQPTTQPIPSFDYKSQRKAPFQKWMQSLRRKAVRMQSMPGPANISHQGLTPYDTQEKSSLRSLGHRASSSGSSFHFVSAIRSASVSLASASIVTRPRRNTARSFRLSKTDRSSRGSISGPRLSEDSIGPERTLVLDAAMVGRSLRRRRILEELINTEECYIGDIRFLKNVRRPVSSRSHSLLTRLIPGICHDSRLFTNSTRRFSRLN